MSAPSSFLCSENREILNEITKNPLYNQAKQALVAGNMAKYHQLVSQLTDNEEYKTKMDTYNKNNKPLLNPETNIDRTSPMPTGYTRNSFSDTTSTILQIKDKPEWNNIIATVEHKGESVYEDHYLLKSYT